jgi:hypothetical protein
MSGDKLERMSWNWTPVLLGWGFLYAPQARPLHAKRYSLNAAVPALHQGATLAVP